VGLAKLNERGMLRASFIPPLEIRQLRDYTRLRFDLTADRCRQVQRLEKLLEDALIKISSVASAMMGVSGRAMIEALIAAERDPRVLADLAKGRLRVKHAALIDALTGRFDDHQAELAALLLEQIDALSAQIEHLDARIEQNPRGGNRYGTRWAGRRVPQHHAHNSGSRSQRHSRLARP
jgi:transposase